MCSRFWLLPILFYHWNSGATEDFKCEFAKKSVTYTYVCSSGPEKKIEIYVQPPHVVGIICHDIDNMNQSILPEIDLGRDFGEVHIYDCPIIHKGFQEILKKFHIDRIYTFEFTAKSTQRPLTTQDFVGLESIGLLNLSCNITHFDGNIFRITSHLTIINLSDNNLVVYEDLFKYSRKLITLNLATNNIKYLPPKIFENLTDLRLLFLDKNKLKYLDDKIFHRLTQLEDLRLNHNLLYRLDDNLFESQENLRFLDISYNKLEYISERMLDNCTSLKIVYIHNNHNLVLENKVFWEILYLNLISLANNDIVSLPENIFTESWNLVEIELQHNKLKSLPKDIFQNQKLLRKLDLKNNRLKTLDPDIFSSLNSLIALSLRQNLLTVVNEGLLKNLEYLETLDLSFNRIYRINSDMFARKYNLIHFSINNNWLDLTEFSTNNMKDCRIIRTLNFANNSLSQFPYGMVETLVERMKMIPKHQLRVSKEVKVYLQNNNISEIKSSRFSSTNSTKSYPVMIRVDISENPINCDCKALDLVTKGKSKSEAVQISNDNVILQYDSLSCTGPPHLANISVREVNRNDLVCLLNKKCTRKNECSCSYKSASETIVIDCSKRNLTEIPQLLLEELPDYFDFIELNRVEVHLEDNLLEAGPTKLDGYHNVNELYLKRNAILSIEWLPSYVEILNLENNQLEFLDAEILNLLNNSIIKKLSLSNNPWRCDCSTEDFMSYLWTHISTISNATYIRCKVDGKPIVFLDKEELCPARSNLASVLFSAVLICFIIISGVIFTYYIYQEEILIWLYARNVCLWLIKEERVDKNKKYDAFVSFAHQDEEFVMDRLVAILELGSPQYKFCVHIRDWIPGEYIATQIANSVRDSRRTLIVLSPNFITSIWGRMEFRTAHTSAMKEGRVRIILIVYGDVEMDLLDDELKAYIRTNTYIKWGDPWFWEKLKYALPRTRHRNKKPRVRMRQNSVQNDIELEETNS